MKVWRVEVQHPVHGTLVHWFRQQLEARIFQMETRDAREPRLVEIPERKDALIAWLNINMGTDNG